MNYGIFNVRTDVNACNCTHGCTDTITESALKAASGRKTESALKVDSGRKIPCCTGESNLHQQRDNLMLWQLSYIPISSSGRGSLFPCFPFMMSAFWKELKQEIRPDEINFFDFVWFWWLLFCFVLFSPHQVFVSVTKWLPFLFRQICQVCANDTSQRGIAALPPFSSLSPSLLHSLSLPPKPLIDPLPPTPLSLFVSV